MVARPCAQAPTGGVFMATEHAESAGAAETVLNALAPDHGGGMHKPESLLYAEEILIEAVEWLRLVVEFIGASIIAVGLVVVMFAILKSLATTGNFSFTRLHIRFARYLSLALEFQLAADILSTAVAPSWEQIGKLGAIAVIRTALNYFLQKEIHEAAHHLKEEEASQENGRA